MKNLIIFGSLCLLAASIEAMSLDELMSPGQKVIAKAQLKNKLLGSQKDSSKSRTQCDQEFLKQKDIYEDLISQGEMRLMEIAGLSQPFSRNEIENMPERHPHIKTTIRGTDINAKYFVKSGSPRFPHAKDQCQNFFEDFVEIVEVDGKLCRRITFEAQEIGDQSYTQEYCENEYSVKIYFN